MRAVETNTLYGDNKHITLQESENRLEKAFTRLEEVVSSIAVQNDNLKEVIVATRDQVAVLITEVEVALQVVNGNR